MGPPVEGLGYFGIIPGGFSVHMFLKLLFKKYYIYIYVTLCVYIIICLIIPKVLDLLGKALSAWCVKACPYTHIKNDTCPQSPAEYVYVVHVMFS